MSDELLVIRKDNKIITARTENSRIVQLEAEDAEEKSILGNIYIGKVKNIVKNINAAFVEFQKGQMGYLPLGIKQCPVHTGAHYQEGRVLIGDEIIVQAEREAIKTKPPALTGILSIPGRCIVLVSEGYSNSVSAKRRDKDARKRLSGINSSYASEDYGFIARTNSADASTEEIVNEIQMLF